MPLSFLYGSCFLCVILSLCVPELIVFPFFICQQHIVASALNEFAFVKNSNIIAEAAGGKPVRNKNGRFIADNFIEPGVNFIF